MIADSGSAGGFLHRALHGAVDIGRSTVLNYIEYRLPGAADLLGVFGVGGWTAYARLLAEPWRAAVSRQTRQFLQAPTRRATPEREEGERDGYPSSRTAPRLSACGPRPCRA